MATVELENNFKMHASTEQIFTSSINFSLILETILFNHFKPNCYARIKHSAIGKSSGNVDDYH